MYPSDLKYTKNHEFIKPLGDGTAMVGITSYAQEALGDVVFVDLPEVGAAFEAGEEFGTVESVKAVSDLYSPVDGEVAAANTAIADKLEHLADDPYGASWFVKIKIANKAGLAQLLDEAAYQKQCEEEPH